ncbi:hypothetical protein HJFPF1_01367 [Paramyrothecium foliicola]|nr:hypothetical protein HJFPF1_01367 [Paramyrothecium foliicola]
MVDVAGASQWLHDATMCVNLRSIPTLSHQDPLPQQLVSGPHETLPTKWKSTDRYMYRPSARMKGPDPSLGAALVSNRPYKLEGEDQTVAARPTMIVLPRMAGFPEPRRRSHGHVIVNHKVPRPLCIQVPPVSKPPPTQRAPLMPSLIERLPAEVQQMIFSSLDYQSLIHLSTMNRYFHRRINPQAMANPQDKVAFVMRAVKDFPQHRPTEKGHEYSPGNFECYICFRVRSPDYFDMFQPSSIHVDSYGQIVRDREPRPGFDREVMLRRFCISCGVKEGIHAPFDCMVTRTGRDLWESSGPEQPNRLLLSSLALEIRGFAPTALACPATARAKTFSGHPRLFTSSSGTDFHAEDDLHSLSSHSSSADRDQYCERVEVINVPSIAYPAAEKRCIPSEEELVQRDDGTSLPIVFLKTPNPLFKNESFCITSSGIAGWGARAARDLRKGDVILRELPILTADYTSLFQAFESLDPDLKNVALSLHANKLLKPGTPRVLAVWETNCFAIGHHLSGLFPVAARFNHACYPAQNIMYRYDRQLGWLEFTVMVESILMGEELTISYGTDLTPIQLYLNYGFRCQCGACPGLSDAGIESLATEWFDFHGNFIEIITETSEALEAE